MREAPTIWAQTATGRALDLIHPTSGEIDLWVDVPEQLARIARYAGACRSGPYSVAQHSVLGADELYRLTKNRALAAAFLLHDVHEIALGDWTRPGFEALIHWAGITAQHDNILRGLGTTTASMAVRRNVRFGLTRLKTELDRAIYVAAGLQFPLDTATRTHIDDMDIRMLKTERQHLLLKPPLPWDVHVEAATPIRIVGKFTIWPWPKAADEFRDRLKRYLPDLRQPTAPPRNPIKPRTFVSA